MRQQRNQDMNTDETTETTTRSRLIGEFNKLTEITAEIVHEFCTREALFENWYTGGLGTGLGYSLIQFHPVDRSDAAVVTAQAKTIARGIGCQWVREKECYGHSYKGKLTLPKTGFVVTIILHGAEPGTEKLDFLALDSEP
jgi:hypothetical protein